MPPLKYYIYILLPLAAVLLGIIKGGFKIKTYKPFMWFIAYATIHQTVKMAFALNGIRNLFFGNIYDVISTFMLAAFFYRLFFKDKTHIKWYWLFCLPALILYLFNLSDFNNDMVLLAMYVSIGISTLACYWLIKLMLNTNISPLKIPSFWFSVSLILFNLGTIIVFNMSRFWDAGAGQWLIDIHNNIVFINIVVYYSLIIIGILCISKKSTSKYSY